VKLPVALQDVPIVTILGWLAAILIGSVIQGVATGYVSIALMRLTCKTTATTTTSKLSTSSGSSPPSSPSMVANANLDADEEGGGVLGDSSSNTSNRKGLQLTEFESKAVPSQRGRAVSAAVDLGSVYGGGDADAESSGSGKKSRLKTRADSSSNSKKGISWGDAPAAAANLVRSSFGGGASGSSAPSGGSAVLEGGGNGSVEEEEFGGDVVGELDSSSTGTAGYKKKKRFSIRHSEGSSLVTNTGGDGTDTATMASSSLLLSSEKRNAGMKWVAARNLAANRQAAMVNPTVASATRQVCVARYYLFIFIFCVR
jgi:hypothetical protein